MRSEDSFPAETFSLRENRADKNTSRSFATFCYDNLVYDSGDGSYFAIVHSYCCILISSPPS